jgi:hypothetical protein
VTCGWGTFTSSRTLASLIMKTTTQRCHWDQSLASMPPRDCGPLLHKRLDGRIPLRLKRFDVLADLLPEQFCRRFYVLLPVGLLPVSGIGRRNLHNAARLPDVPGAHVVVQAAEPQPATNRYTFCSGHVNALGVPHRAPGSRHSRGRLRALPRLPARRAGERPGREYLARPERVAADGGHGESCHLAVRCAAALLPSLNRP